ncbi:MAG TPA: DUF4166 domain-containing protein [Pyrinomonadaceae bacterium]|nr:DUF4166 domain-containing protein [Pyrinomonadaceae bacterium]
METPSGGTDEGREAAGFYARLAGEAWADVCEPVRRFHSGGPAARWSGRFNVSHGPGFVARTLARVMRLPAAGEGLSVRLVVTDEGGRGERWERTFGGRPFVTSQSEHGEGFLAERVGPVEVLYRLEAEGGALLYRQARAALCAGPLRLRLPRGLAPSVEAREWAEAGEAGVWVRVRVRAPLVGTVVTYEGRVEPEVEGG